MVEGARGGESMDEGRRARGQASREAALFLFVVIVFIFYGDYGYLKHSSP